MQQIARSGTRDNCADGVSGMLAGVEKLRERNAG